MDNFGAGPAGFLRKEFSDRELSRKEHSRINGRGQRGLPFYMAYPELLFQEDAVTRDLEYLIQLYPEQAGRYLERISRMLDHLDYRGSMIYDEYPDRLALFRLAESIQEQTRREEEQEKGDSVKPDQEPVFTKTESGADDRDRKTLIQILLYYEIFRRRRKSGKMPVVYPDKNDYNGYGG